MDRSKTHILESESELALMKEVKSMNIDDMILDEERKINEADTSRITYEILDMNEEVKMMKRVGFQILTEGGQYNLLKEENTYALIIETWVIQGPSCYVFDCVASSKLLSVLYPELYLQLLEVVRQEGAE